MYAYLFVKILPVLTHFIVMFIVSFHEVPILVGLVNVSLFFQRRGHWVPRQAA